MEGLGMGFRGYNFLDFKRNLAKLKNQNPFELYNSKGF